MGRKEKKGEMRKHWAKDSVLDDRESRGKTMHRQRTGKEVKTANRLGVILSGRADANTEGGIKNLCKETEVVFWVKIRT